MFHFILKNPVCSILVMCLSFFITAGIFFYSKTPDTASVHFLLLTIILVCCTPKKFRLLALISGLIIFVICMLSAQPQVLLLGEAGLIFFVWQQHQKENDAVAFLIIALSFIFHLYYVQFSDVGERQHDLGGIIFYMKMITKGGVNWQGFDPWYMYYFFHQPLHFLITGYIYFAELFLWHSEAVAQEGLQYLSLFYVSASTIVSYGIFKMLNLPAKLSITALVLLAFNPTLFLFAGYISDDTAVLFWNILLIYFLIKWFNSEKVSSLALGAICLGLGTLTKLSVLVWVPAICVLFLYKIFESANKRHIFEGIGIFVIIAVPLSLIWIVHNHILFDMAFYNIPDTSPNGQNFRYLTFFERISDFSLMTKPFINSPNVVEGNIWLALVKTELFGEWDFSLHHSIIRMAAILLYWLNILFKLCCGIGGIWLVILTFKKKINIPSAFLIFFVIGYYVIWGYAFKYAMDYPYACSSDYRLFASLILPEVILLALFAQQLKATKILFVASIFYALLNCFIYTVIA